MSASGMLLRGSMCLVVLLRMVLGGLGRGGGVFRNAVVWLAGCVCAQHVLAAALFVGYGRWLMSDLEARWLLGGASAWWPLVGSSAWWPLCGPLSRGPLGSISTRCLLDDMTLVLSLLIVLWCVCREVSVYRGGGVSFLVSVVSCSWS